MEETKTYSAERQSWIAYLKQVWKFRGLAITFAERDLKVKYAQTLLGLLWSVVQPITGLLIFTLFFGLVIKVDTKGIPYPLFALSGMVGWYYFTYIFAAAGTSLREAQSIIRKVSFPKLILPLSKVIVGGVDFVFSFIILVIAMLFYGKFPSLTIVLFPLFVLLNIVTALSVAIWLSALTIRYRDMHHIIPYVLNFSIWLTPVFYPFTFLPHSISRLLYLNPMALVIEGYRYTLLNGPQPSPYFLLSVIPVLILFFTGLAYFIRTEDEIVDKV